MKIHSTAYAELGYTQTDDGTWRIVRVPHAGQPAVLVGDSFTDRNKLLAALPDYASTHWGYPRPPDDSLDAGAKDLVSRLAWALEGFYASESMRREGKTPCETALDALFEEVEALRPLVGQLSLGRPAPPKLAQPPVIEAATPAKQAIKGPMLSAVVGMASLLRRSGT